MLSEGPRLKTLCKSKKARGFISGFVWACFCYCAVSLAILSRKPYPAEIPSWERNEEKDVDELARNPA